eukprot:CAMPEP_0113953094 /NCGR_PEP_ID=MMETSP1339-20121228/90794_1 /TAXON_ID=94617 /ORGANISM="Fibrocapsa japonica" /LENGTH=262 /DNA_ID=CAMNT_0000961801 /DNA_START=75 /DNA_END=863 /DNA_ORIENTATION=- /assembly_acc=CAM_ASM_000762
MEFIKTQLQLQEKAATGQKPKFTGMIGGFRYVISSQGFLGLYRGLAPTLVGSLPKAGIRFGANAQFKKMLAGPDGKVSTKSQFFAGLMAGAIEATLATTPIETVKTKLIQTNSGFVSGIRQVMATEGIGGLYQGLQATVLKQGFNQGLRFMWFNEYKGALERWGYTDGSGLAPIQSLLGGMSAGVFSTLGTNPFDVVKTRMQGVDAKKYKGTLDCFKTIGAKEGMSAYYTGVVPRLCRVVPGQGIIFMSFETIQSWVEKRLK